MSTVLWLFFLAGGLAGDEIVPPELPDDAVLSEDVVVAPTLDLRQAVALALRNNFDILAGADAVAIARFSERAARAEFLPKIQPGISRSLTRQDGLESRRYSLRAEQVLPWLGGTVSARGDLLAQPPDELRGPRVADLSLSLSQPLLRDFGPTATFEGLTTSRRAREAEERQLWLSQQSLVERVTEAYFGVVRQRQLLTVARQSLERNQKLLEASRARMEAGLSSKLDVFRADLQVQVTQDAMVSAEAALASTLETFRVLLGLSPTDVIEPEHVALKEDLALDLPPVSVLISRALKTRLDLKESHDQIADARRSAGLAKQDLLPQLDLNVEITRFGFGPTFGQSLRAMDQRVDVFLTTSYPLESAAARARKATADLRVAGAQRSYRQRELEVEAEVRAAVRDLERMMKSVQLQKTNVELATQQQRLAILRYQRGLATNFDVVEAEESLVTARAALVNLLAEFQIGRVHLLRTTGDLDPFKEPVP